MPRQAERTETEAPNIRPMVSGALFPLGVTVDRNIVRLFMATAISCLQLATMLYGGAPIIANLAATGLYVLWAIVGLFPPRYGSPIFDAPAWIGRVVELALCGAIIATGGPVLIAFLAAAVAMFMPAEYLRHITRWTALKALVIAAFVCGALLIGHRLAPAIMQAPASPIDEAFAALVFSLFAAALGGGKSVASTLSWDDELSHHVAFASKAPAERLLELVAEGINGTAVMIFTPAPDRPIAARFVAGDRIDTVEIPDEEIAKTLYAPTGDSRPILFDAASGRVLRDDHRQRIGIVDMVAFSRAWNRMFGPVRGAAIPIAMGRVRGWLYIATGQDLSHRSHLEVRRVFADISAMIMRFERLDSWRDRTLAEARLLASRDMHDSVLQTLAGLRMQLSSMVKSSETAAPALNAQMKALDAIVAAEQQHLRAILQRSHRDAETAAELFSYLKARTQSLARQWNVRCTVETPDETLPVSEETAIECEFLLREAMSNAAQHAGADHILMKIGLDDSTLLVTLRTEGMSAAGIGGKRPHGRLPVESRSLRQRVEKLGGTAYLESVSGGGILSIQIPLERK